MSGFKPSKSPMGWRGLLFVALIGLSVLNGCKDARASKAAAAQGVAQFHAGFNKSDWVGIYDGADPMFRSRGSQSNFFAYASGARSKLGPVVSTSNKKYNVRVHTGSTSIVVEQLTNFEHGTGVEVYGFSIRDERAQLTGWDVRSDVFILK